MNTTMTMTTGVSKTSWSESAYDWLLRSQQQQAHATVPHDPSSAAWSFVRPGQGTGVAFVDAALKKQSMPVMELSGAYRTGKTWTLLTLAARFVVSTRPSRFTQASASESTSTDDYDDVSKLPQVVLIDSQQAMLASKILCAVRTALLRQCPDDIPESTLQQEIASCMGRIHVIMSEDVVGWVAILEALRCKLSGVSDHPTLMLWDGFLCDINDTSGRMEIIRQMSRLLKDCTVLLITTSTRKFGLWENKLVTQRIRLERLDPVPTNGGHEFVATIQDIRIPYSISLGTILS